MTSPRNNTDSCCFSIVHDYFSALTIQARTQESQKHDALPVVWHVDESINKHMWTWIVLVEKWKKCRIFASGPHQVCALTCMKTVWCRWCKLNNWTLEILASKLWNSLWFCLQLIVHLRFEFVSANRMIWKIKRCIHLAPGAHRGPGY